MKQNFKMINVGEKEITKRTAIAKGNFYANPEIINRIINRDTPKGDVLAMGEVAGIMAAKNTSQILPLCHPLLLDSIRIWFDFEKDHISAYCEVITHSKTGVEMEALTGVTATLLSIYDLTKIMDPALHISGIHLMEKIGGKSGHWHHPHFPVAEIKNSHITFPSLSQITSATIVLSDRAAAGVYEDKSGAILNEYLKKENSNQIDYKIIPDDKLILKNLLQELVLDKQVQLILISGGTGIGPRDITIDTIKEMNLKELSGFGELMRKHGDQFTKRAWLSRSSAYIMNQTFIVTFPGSPNGVKDGLQAVGEIIPHAIKMIKGEGH